MSNDTGDGGPKDVDGETFDGVEYLLFDSLLHHLIEKGVLTKNDALSVVQTAAEVVRGQTHETAAGNDRIRVSLSKLERTYLSFEALRDRYGKSGMDGENVHQLRTPFHGDRPNFPRDDD